MNELLPEQLKERVRDLLLNHAPMKDNDRILMSAIWMQECDKAVDFLVGFMAGDYTCSESIRRCRQQLQEKHPKLRGHRYIIRKTRAANIRKNIKLEKSKITYKKIFLDEDLITNIKLKYKRTVMGYYITSKELLEHIGLFLQEDIKSAYMTLNRSKNFYIVFNEQKGAYEFYKS
jgi:hypothetical protein